MEVGKVNIVNNSCVVNTSDVTFQLTVDERRKVAKALEVIGSLNKKAMKALGRDESFGDFTSYRYRRKGDKVIVYVRQGMVG